ncbi:non-homologous end-joining DNA ligase [Actinoalloteichus spitiensis]|uniref:non-homologous end-joining DNA ligase n=1 Tax=Actinoalloteichus spitiensis TaxID=252394 RepID=UPI000380BF26|nr:non-homologous end-joining DNA ligase [Actinoalloteichus spitiensis]
MADLDEYRRRRDPRRTPEPVPDHGPLPHGADDVFVVQEHHARRLHWDVRLERNGVLVSWAVPKGLPAEPGTVRLAVHTEDHPLDYADFEGRIPKGEYGAGEVLIWDRGIYETRKWTDHEVDVVLHGNRVIGRYVFFGRGGDWMVRRSDPPQDPDRVPVPEDVTPMLATPGTLPNTDEDDQWCYEFKWDGARALAEVEGGRLRLRNRRGEDVTATYPELRGLGEQLGSTQALLDGEIVVLDQGRPNFALLQRRLHVTGQARTRRLAEEHPATLLVFDLLHLDGRNLLDLPYARRRELLDELAPRGPHWQTPPSFSGGGAAVLQVSRERGFEGIVAKHRDSPYRPGRRSPAWTKIKDVRTQEVVVGGWRPGEGRRSGVLGSLLLGIPGPDGLRFVGSVGSGFSEAELRRLTGTLRELARPNSPFAGPVPTQRARSAHWVEPRLVGEVLFQEWTRDGRLRAPRWRGLRDDKRPEEVTEGA